MVSSIVRQLKKPSNKNNVVFKSKRPSKCRSMDDLMPEYQRVIEVIDENSKQAGRQRFKAYREAEHNIETHKI